MPNPINACPIWGKGHCPVHSQRVYDTYEGGHNRRSNSAHMANAIPVALVAGYAA